MNTWFYSHSAQTYGPVTKEQLVAMIQAGQLMGEHFIMREGGDEWLAVNASPFSGYLPPKATLAMPAHFASAAAPAAAAPQAAPAAQPVAKPAARPAGPPQARPAAPRSQAPAVKTAAKSGKGPRMLVFGTLGLLAAAAGWFFLAPKADPARKITKRLEGEALKVIKTTGGDVEPQPVKQSNALWSGDAHLWWHGGAANYSLDLEFNVEEGQGGKQRLKAAFTSSYDYGTVEVSLDGKKLKGCIYDLQANGAVISGARDLGLHDLAVGPHVLRIGILDTSVIHMDKRDAYSVGLDYLQLEPSLLEEAPASTGTDIALKAQPSASHCPAQDHVNVMNDGKTFAKDLSNDDSRRRHSWWPHFGSAEWAQYEWNSPQAIQECQVLWYSDRTDPNTPEGCGLPVFWRILYREESSGAWVPVDATIPAATRDEWNRVKFTPVKTTALRLSVQCPGPQSVGIYSWKVLAADPTTVTDPKTREHPDLFLGDLSPLHAQVGSEAYRMNSLTASAIRDNVVVMGNRMPCSQFLWAHADSRLDFGIPEGYTRFTTFGVGYADPRTGEPMGLTDWNYTVMVDGRIVEKSNVLTTYKDKQFTVDVTFPAGSKVLTLLSANNGNGYGDHSHWAFPTLLTASSQKRPATPTMTDKWPKLTASAVPISSAPTAASKAASSSIPPSQPSAPPATLAEQIARFTFEHVIDEPGKQLGNALQHDGILEVVGIYDPDKPAIQLKTPKLDYRRFTVAVRLHPDDFGIQPDYMWGDRHILLVGGRSTRWFDLSIARDGSLGFGMSDLGYANSSKDTSVRVGKWSTIVITSDMEARQAKVFVDGRLEIILNFKKDAALKVIGSRWEESDKEWLFTHFGTGDVFCGAVDELAVFNGILSDKAIATLNFGGSNPNPPRIIAPPTKLAKKSMIRLPQLHLTEATITEAVAEVKKRLSGRTAADNPVVIDLDPELVAQDRRLTLDAADIPLCETLRRFAEHYGAYVHATDESFLFKKR